MLLYLSVSSENETFVRRHWRDLAHMDYRISSDGQLLRSGRPKCGLMVLSDAGSPDYSDRRALAEQVLHECRVGAFGGIVADFEQSPTEESFHFLRLVGENLRYEGRRFFVPEPYALCCKSANVLFPTAISGGSFADRLRQKVKLIGARRLALDLQWLRMDFPLPCPGGEGQIQTESELRYLIEAEKPMSFHSSSLAADYFSYEKEGEHRFVLYDTPATLAAKLRFASSLGCETAFLLASEAESQLIPLLGFFKRQKLI